ncbi:MAG TPA: aldose 1-epimerase [Thermoplasmataceae archaeon]|nr:aldose 1-epimerase [Thermoplasmataceae archaeon]
MIQISSSSGKAALEEKGAYLRSLALGGQDIIKGSADGKPTHGGSAVLIPYAGRVKNATYTFEGKKYDLPENNGEHSIHGYLKDVLWSVKEKSEDSVTFSSDFSDTGYPSSIHTEIEYRIGGQDLTVITSVRNSGTEDIPLLIGFHPYFITGVAWALSHTEPLRKLNFEEGFFPDGTYEDIDFNRMKNPQDMSFDNSYVGGGEITLSRKGGSIVIRRTNMPYLVIYNGTYSEGKSVAIEPMTGAPDAFNNGIGLITVEPGKSFNCTFSVEFKL